MKVNPSSAPDTNAVRRYRHVAQLTQQELATRVGVSRQTVVSIEAGKLMPGALLALRLARTFRCSVEDLFSLPEERASDAVEFIDGAEPASSTRRVQLARVGERMLALPLEQAAGLSTSADGVIRAAGGSLTVETFIGQERLDHTLLVQGCDPALSLLADHLGLADANWRALVVSRSSTTALQALGRGRAHLVGCHLSEPGSGESNLPSIKRELPQTAVSVITLSEWRQGWLVQPGNPLQFRNAADLVRSDIHLINRDAGSGTRLLLDTWIAAIGVPPARILGYGSEAPSHIAVAEAIRSGRADAGVGIEAVALAYGLDFLPVQTERYDLVIPDAFMYTAGVQLLLNVVTSRPFRRELESLGGYDTRQTGHVVATLGTAT